MGLVRSENYPTKDVVEQTTQMVTMKNSSRISAFKSRFGWLTIILNFLGILVVIGILVTLDLFWRWGEDPHKIEREEDSWGKLALANFSEQTITILCAVLRAFLGAQALLCCYMIASYTTEKSRLPQKDTDMIFIYQFANEGPLAMVGIFGSSIFNTKSSKVHFYFPFVVLILLLLTSIATQLSSTILLSDLTTEMIPNTTQSQAIPMTSPGRTECALETSNPYNYPIFAENTTESFFEPGDASTPGFYDSGWVQRAFIPLSKEERESIISYKGPANVLTTRQFCFPPPLNSSLEIPETFLPPWQVTKYLVDRAGEFGYTKALNDSLFSKKGGWGDTGVKHRVSTTGAALGVMRGGSPVSWSAASGYGLFHQLVFNNRLGAPKVEGDFEYSGEWVRRRQMEVKETRTQVPAAALQVDYSMCLRYFNWTDMIIEAETDRSQPVREPTPVGSSIIFANMPVFPNYRFTWIMDSVRSLLDPDRKKSTSTKVLKLIRTTDLPPAVKGTAWHEMALATGNYYCDWTTPPPNAVGRFKSFCFDQFDPARTAPTSAFNTCSDSRYYPKEPIASISPYVTPSRPYIDLINQTINDNGHAGQAVDFYDAVLQANSYYANVPFFTKNNASLVYNGTVQLLAERSIPTKRNGFRAVCGLVGLHFFLFFVCYFAYLSTETSRVGLEVEGISEFRNLKRDTINSVEGSEELVALRSGEGIELERR